MPQRTLAKDLDRASTFVALGAGYLQFPFIWFDGDDRLLRDYLGAEAAGHRVVGKASDSLEAILSSAQPEERQSLIGKLLHAEGLMCLGRPVVAQSIGISRTSSTRIRSFREEIIESKKTTIAIAAQLDEESVIYPVLLLQMRTGLLLWQALLPKDRKVLDSYLRNQDWRAAETTKWLRANYPPGYLPQAAVTQHKLLHDGFGAVTRTRLLTLGRALVAYCDGEQAWGACLRIEDEQLWHQILFSLDHRASVSRFAFGKQPPTKPFHPRSLNDMLQSNSWRDLSSSQRSRVRTLLLPTLSASKLLPDILRSVLRDTSDAEAISGLTTVREVQLNPKRNRLLELLDEDWPTSPRNKNGVCYFVLRVRTEVETLKAVSKADPNGAFEKYIQGRMAVLSRAWEFRHERSQGSK